MHKQQILIVDDEEINRVILKGLFQDEYQIIEAGNGQEAIARIEENQNIVLILLDIVMPIMNGFGVLEYMKGHDLLEKIPVILITGETVIDSDDQAYAYGVADVMHKPFYPHIVKRRGKNIIELYQNKHYMQERLKEQEEAIRAQEKKIRESNEFMIDALSSVVEFRSLETGEHIRRIKFFTRILLKYLMKYFPKYGLTPVQVDEIARAAALHDIGKIGIPDAILLKPARLTPEEFEVMKTHTTIGCDVLERFREKQTEEFYKYCYEICRYHHERWDGNGYPDHLVGDEIPISAHIVAIADVYDALVSPRVYKSIYANNIAYDMIMKGECGQFSPDVLECFALAKEDFFNVVEVIKMFDFSS
ncbi:MAG: response regulator [Lachnospiraceae bacterium]|jgi:putative two-component system response regulator|nr:response regulator [Lachnospiraceae bacterium]GFI03680.1 putative cyclic di-GMP phosphodiesterase [Lachnospiraceae bacterium]